jgi:hypothetical protein
MKSAPKSWQLKSQQKNRGKKKITQEKYEAKLMKRRQKEDCNQHQQMKEGRTSK